MTLWTPADALVAPLGAWDAKRSDLLGLSGSTVNQAQPLAGSLVLNAVGSPVRSANEFGTGYAAFRSNNAGSGGNGLKGSGTFTGNTYTVYALALFDSGSEDGSRAIGLGDANGDLDFNDPARASLLYYHGTDGASAARNGAIGAHVGQAITPGTAFLWKVVVKNGLVSVSVNGAAPSSYNPGTGTTGFNAVTFAILQPARSFFQLGQLGALNDVIFLDYEPGTAEDDRFLGYVAWNNNRAALLPSGHTYASAAPTTGSGPAPATGTISATEAADTVNVAASSGSSGTAAATDAPDTVNLAAQSGSTGTINATEGTQDGAAATGTVAWRATVAATEAQDTATAAGTSGSSATLAATDAQDTAAGAGTSKSTGTIAATEAQDTANVAAVSGTGVAGNLNATEAQDTATLAGQSKSTATMAATDAQDSAAGSGASGSTGSMSAGENVDTVAMTGTDLTPRTATLSATEAADTASAVGKVVDPAVGTLNAAEAQDSATASGFSGNAPPSGALSAVEAQDDVRIRIVSPVERIRPPGPLAGTGIDRRTGQLIFGFKHVRQCLEVIFTTRIGERVMRRAFGSHVPGMLGKNIVPRTVLRFAAAVIVALDFWEPRFAIKQITFEKRTNSPEKLRAGGLTMILNGEYRPRAHRGDLTPEGADRTLEI